MNNSMAHKTIYLLNLFIDIMNLNLILSYRIYKEFNIYYKNLQYYRTSLISNLRQKIYECSFVKTWSYLLNVLESIFLS